MNLPGVEGAEGGRGGKLNCPGVEGIEGGRGGYEYGAYGVVKPFIGGIS